MTNEKQNMKKQEQLQNAVFLFDYLLHTIDFNEWYI